MIKNLIDKLLARSSIDQATPEPSVLSPSEQMQAQQLEKKTRNQFMTRIYRMVTTHRDGEAMLTLLQQFDAEQTPTTEIETLFKDVQQWGPSRTLMCVGRWLIQRLHEDKRYGRALYFIEQCQAVGDGFILAELSQTLFYARQAIDLDKPQVAVKLLQNPYTRYGDEVDAEQCIKLLAQIVE